MDPDDLIRFLYKVRFDPPYKNLGSKNFFPLKLILYYLRFDSITKDKTILIDLLWNFFIIDKLNLIFDGEDYPKKIIISVPKTLKFWDFNAFIDKTKVYEEYNKLEFVYEEISDWAKEDNNFIFFNNDVLLPDIFDWLNEDFVELKVFDDEKLTRIHLEFLIKKILNISENLSIDLDKWSEFVDLIQLRDVEVKAHNLINKIEELNKSELDNQVELSNFSFNLIIYYLIHDNLPEIDYTYFEFITSFFKIHINKIFENKRDLVELSIGFTFIFEEKKILEVNLLSELIKKYKIAKIDLIEFSNRNRQLIICIIPNYLWYYLEIQLKKKNYDWINELLWTFKHKYTRRSTNDLLYSEKLFDKKLDAYFWLKLFLYSEELINNNDYNHLKKYYISFLNKFISLIKYLIDCNKEPIKNFKDYSNKFHIFEEKTIQKLKDIVHNFELNLLRKESQNLKTFTEIPIKFYKPDFSLKFSLSINIDDEMFVKHFPEIQLFQIITPNPTNLNNYLKEIIKQSDLIELFKKLLIFRFYEIIFNDEMDVLNSKLNYDKFKIIRIARNLLNYRIWNIFSKDSEFMDDYWKHKQELWLYDYYKLESLIENPQKYSHMTEFNSIGFFNTINAFLKFYDIDSLVEIYKSKFAELSVPIKVFTEYLLFSQNFTIRDEKIRKLKNTNVILIIFDGLSYTAAKRFKFNDDYIVQIDPVLIYGLTKTVYQLTKIWDNLSGKSNIEVCEDTNLASELLFSEIPSLNAYVIDNGYHELLIEYQNKISEFFNPNNFYFVYIANNESLNKQINEEKTFIERYQDLLKKIIDDIKKISNKYDVELFITSDHGSILVEENNLYTELFNELKKPFGKTLTRKKTPRAFYFKESTDYNNEDLDILSSILIKNQLNDNPQFSLPPKIILSKKKKYDHSGISIDENIVPWIKVIFKK